MTKNTVMQLPPNTLAYIGDSVYELYVRERVVLANDIQIDKLHRMVVSKVNAKSQSEVFRRIEGKLNEEELWVYKRGRNAKSTIPKNSEVIEYRVATGFEALVGYLYLSGEHERLEDILQEALI